jgi:hypothetical protein
MRYLGHLATIPLLIAAAGTMSAEAQDPRGPEGPSFAVSADVGNAYIWRGQVVSDRAVMQPAFDFGWGGLSANVWGNINLDTGDGRSVELNEVDYTVAYGFEAGRVGLALGLIHYDFPHSDAPGTTEAFVGVEIGDLPVTPSLNVYRDFDEADGTYVSLGLGRTIHTWNRFQLDVDFSAGWASAGYNRYYFSVDEAAFNDGNLALSGTWTLGRGFDLNASAQYTWLWDSQVREGAGAIYADDSGFAVLVGLAYSF